MTEAAERAHMCTHTHDCWWMSRAGGTPAPTLEPAFHWELPPHRASSGSSGTLLPGVGRGGLTTPVSPQPWGRCLGHGSSWGVTGPSTDTRLPWDPCRHSLTLRHLLPRHDPATPGEAGFFHPAGPSAPKSSAHEARDSYSLATRNLPISWTDISQFSELLNIALLFIPNFFLKRLQFAFLQRQQLELSKLLLVNTFKHCEDAGITCWSPALAARDST